LLPHGQVYHWLNFAAITKPLPIASSLFLFVATSSLAGEGIHSNFGKSRNEV